jgi:hypothetical protein
LLESNTTVLYRRETTGVDREDKNNKDKSDTNQGRIKIPSIPVSKQAQNYLSTPIRRYLKNRKKQAIPRRSLGKDQSSNRINLGNTILALIDKLKTTRIQQETKDKLVANRIAVLQTEIAALQTDNILLKKKLREISKELWKVSKELKVLVTSSNTKIYTEATARTEEGLNQQRIPQFSTI